MRFEIHLSEQAIKDLGQLDSQVANQIVSKLDQYQASNRPLQFSKTLQGSLKCLYRFRIGDYRAIFRKEPSGKLIILFVLTIKNRNEAYD